MTVSRLLAPPIYAELDTIAWKQWFQTQYSDFYTPVFNTGLLNGPTLSLAQNGYYNGAWYYLNTAGATLYLQTGDAHEWYCAASGTAGGAITYVLRMTLDATNNDLLINQYTQLGSSAPKIATKKLTVTSANAQGGAVTVAHGLTGAKIISFTAKLEYAANGGVPPEYTFNAGYQYSVYHDATNFNVQNSAANSIAILSKNVIIYVTYER